MTSINATLFFRATDAVNGAELWTSDGTAAGTVMVKDIKPGAAGSSPSNYTEFDGHLIFTASNGVNGTELWKSNGTAAGTVLLKDVRSGGSSSFPTNLTVMGDTLYFSAVGAEGRELWKTDGTGAGTVLVKDIIPGSTGSGPQYLEAVNGILFFAADDGVNGYELWKSDGTEPGTVLVKDIYPSSPSSITLSGLNFVNVGGTLFLRAEDGSNGIELWKSDGTPAGTVMVKDISPGTLSGNPRHLYNGNGLLYFYGATVPEGREPWISDGTPEGTMLLKDIQPGSGDGLIDPPQFTSSSDLVYFRAKNILGGELWNTDGTTANTDIVKDISPGAGAGAPPTSLTDVNGILYFSAEDNGVTGNGYELWKSDGSEAGTVLVSDINPGPADSNPSHMTNVNGTLFFNADDGSSGEELWAMIPTASPLGAAVLPSSRSVQVGQTATAFVTILNTDVATASNCGIALLTSIPAGFSYQTTDPATNALTGTPDTPVDIPAGTGQTYVLALTPTAPISPTDVRLSFNCSNTSPAPIFRNAAVNTLLFSCDSLPIADVIAQGATPSGDGIVNIPGSSGNAAFAVGSFNVGATESLTVGADTGNTTLPVILNVCQTDPVTGACISAIQTSITHSMPAGSSASYAVFVSGTASVPFDAVNNRITVRFTDPGGVVRGATSVAVRTQ